MTKKFLIVVDSIDVNDSSGSKANVALIKNLATIGYGVTVMHFTQKNIQLKDIECILVNEKKYTLLYFLSRTQRVIQRYFNINLATYLESIFGFSFTFFNDVNSIKKALKKLDTSKFGLILTLSKGASFRPHYAVSKLPDLHEKWMAYIHDPFPMSCYPPPYNWKDPGYKLKERFFSKLSKNAKYSAFPSLLLKQWMGSYFPNFIKTGIIIPHQNSEIKIENFKRPDYFKNSKFTLLHAGNLMKQRNPEGLIKGFELFLKNNPEAKNDAMLLLLGNAKHHRKLIENYNKLIPQLFVDIKNRPFEEIYWLQQEVSVNIILEAESEISPFLPGKFPHCVAANKPILHLGPRNSETKRLLGEEYEYHSSISNIEMIVFNIEKLYNTWLKDGNKQKLNRNDLEYYISTKYLYNIVSSL